MQRISLFFWVIMLIFISPFGGSNAQTTRTTQKNVSAHANAQATTLTRTLVPSGGQVITHIVTGGAHSVAINTNRRLIAWGLNTDGQTSIDPARNSELAIDIAAGTNHSLAIMRDGQPNHPAYVYAWGDNSAGQIDIPRELADPDNGYDVYRIAAGQRHSAAAACGNTQCTLFLWGDNTYGQLNIPANLTVVRGLAAGDFHTLAIKTDGTVVAWGRNNYDQVKVPSALKNVVQVSAGNEFSVALKNDGTVVVWGNSSESTLAVPSAIQGRVTRIAVGNSHIVALINDGTVVAWGSNLSGQTSVPTGLNNVTSIAAGGAQSVALKGDGSVIAWGNNQYGQLDIPAFPTVTLTATKTRVVPPNEILDIKAGWGHALALRNDGRVEAWGRNDQGQTNVPSNLTSVKAIDAGCSFSMALRQDGTVIAWGSNLSGQTTIPPGLNNVKAIAAGCDHAVALKNDGSIVLWGDNSNQQLVVPAQVSSSEVTAIDAGDYATAVLTKSGLVYTWGFSGNNSYNQPGTSAIAYGGSHLLFFLTNNTLICSLPNTAPAYLCDVSNVSGNVIKIDASADYSLALHSDGHVSAWGDYWRGNTAVPSNAMSGVKSITAGYLSSYAIKNDGSVVAWGDNSYGQLNIPSFTTRTNTRTRTNTYTPTTTRTSTSTRTNTLTRTNTRTNTPTRTRTNTRTNTSTKTATHTRTSTPTITPLPSNHIFLFVNSGSSGWIVASNFVNLGTGPKITLTRGDTYWFQGQFNASHYLAIAKHPLTFPPSLYTGITGFPFTSTDGGYVAFTVPMNAPSKLYYVCTVHAPMSGEIAIVP